MSKNAAITRVSTAIYSLGIKSKSPETPMFRVITDVEKKTLKAGLKNNYLLISEKIQLNLHSKRNPFLAPMNGYQTYTDAALLQLLKEGKDAAFNELYYRYRDGLARYALQITGDEAEAGDMVQQLFISFWSRRFELDIHLSLKAYFYKSIRNLAARYVENNIRKAKLLESFAYHLDIQTVHLPDNDMAVNEINYQLEKVVESMPSKMRQVYLLSREEQLSHREIGLRLNIAESTVKKHVQNALKMISVEFPRYSMIALGFIIVLIK